MAQSNSALVESSSSEVGSLTQSIYLPVVSSPVSASNELSTISPDELLRQLILRYHGTGITFSLTNPMNDEMVRASDNHLSSQLEFIEVSSIDQLFEVVDFVYAQTQIEEENLSLELNEEVEDVQAASNYTIASWYQFACGGGSYYLGGVFCWKNIDYTWDWIPNTPRWATNLRIRSSWLTGTNALQWYSRYSWGNVLVDGRADLYSAGTYQLGIQIGPLPIYTTWNDTWYRRVRIPGAN